VGVSVAGQAIRARGQLITTNMFGILGVRTPYGRALSDADNDEPSVVLAYDTWQRLFGGDVSAVGRTIAINGRPFTIVGVTARGFSGPDRFEPSDLWIPLGAHASVRATNGDALSNTNWWLTGIGRLSEGSSLRQAQSVLEGVAGGIAAALPASHTGFTVRVSPYQGTSDETRGQILPAAALVMGITICVLLIACANVAGLLLSRAAARQREIGIRLAIGATAGALTRQFLSESLVLAAAAGTTGLLLALWGTEAIVRFAEVPAVIESAPDWRVLVFTVSVSLLAGITFGLAPALRAARLPLLPALRSEPGTDSAHRTSRLQRALVIGQLAMSLVMLASAGILVRGLSAAWRADVGFAYEDRVAVATDLRLQNYDRPRAAAFHARVVAGVRALPGIEQATLAHLVPFGGRVFVHGLTLPGQAADPSVRPERISVNRVWTDFFATLKIPIVRGRPFIAADLRPGADAAVVSQTMADRFWPAGNAIGQRFSIDGSTGPFRTVVGVAGDVQIDEFTERPWPAAWLPYETESGELVILASSTRAPAQVLREIEGVVRGLDPALPLVSSRPVRAYVAERLDGERALSRLLTICGVVALGLAALGLYGLTAYGVARRTREIGVRMALGADRRDVLGLFVREGLWLGAHGIAWGILPAIAATYGLAGLFVGVFPVDAPTLLVSTAILVGVTLLAAYLPARRATSIDPLIALRAE